jgi:hypothetical protein
MIEYPFLRHNAIDDNFRNYMIELINNNTDKFKENNAGPNRFYWSIGNDEIINNIRITLANEFQLKDFCDEPFFGNYIGFIVGGGFIHPHMDGEIKGHRHVRINVNILCGNDGMACNDGKILIIKPKDAYITFASLVQHASMVVIGDIPRVTLSLGYQIPNQLIDDNFMPKYKEWLND